MINPSPGLFQRAEVPLSGAILVADIKAAGFNGNITYSPVNTYSDTVDQTRGDVSPYGIRGLAGGLAGRGIVLGASSKTIVTGHILSPFLIR